MITYSTFFKKTFYRLYVVAAGGHSKNVLEENEEIVPVCIIKIHNEYQSIDGLKRKVADISRKTIMPLIINSSSEMNDIALLELCKPMSLNSYINSN